MVCLFAVFMHHHQALAISRMWRNNSFNMKSIMSVYCFERISTKLNFLLLHDCRYTFWFKHAVAPNWWQCDILESQLCDSLWCKPRTDSSDLLSLLAVSAFCQYAAITISRVGMDETLFSTLLRRSSCQILAVCQVAQSSSTVIASLSEAAYHRVGSCTVIPTPARTTDSCLGADGIALTFGGGCWLMPDVLLLLLPLPPVPAWTCRVIPGVIVLLGAAVNHLGTVIPSSLLAPALPESSELTSFGTVCPLFVWSLSLTGGQILTFSTFKNRQYRKLSSFMLDFLILCNFRSLLLLRYFIIM